MALLAHAYPVGTGYTPEIVEESAKDALVCVRPILDELLKEQKFPDTAPPEDIEPRFLIRFDKITDELENIADTAKKMSHGELREAYRRISDIRNTLVYGLKK